MRPWACLARLTRSAGITPILPDTGPGRNAAGAGESPRLEATIREGSRKKLYGPGGVGP